MDYECCKTCIIRSMCKIKDSEEVVRCDYFLDHNSQKVEKILLSQLNKNRKQKILNSAQTRQALTPKEKLEDFLKELVTYLKTRLNHFTNENGEIEWTCNQDHYSIDFKPFDRVDEFCIKKGLYWIEVLDLIDQYTEDYCECECHLLNDNNIKKLIGK